MNIHVSRTLGPIGRDSSFLLRICMRHNNRAYIPGALKRNGVVQFFRGSFCNSSVGFAYIRSYKRTKCNLAGSVMLQ